MRAVAFHRFGGPEVLEVAELPIPEPGQGEVRVRVAAATVNPTDLGMRSGRRAADLENVEPPYVPGMELAGTIDAVGSGVEWHLEPSVGHRAAHAHRARGQSESWSCRPSRSHVAEALSSMRRPRCR